jgi:asparagine synthase (glutamine-hydrolysing)
MCGIAGIAYSNREHPVEESLLRRMAAVIRHRGPDAEGFHCEPGVGLASRRLSIIDVDGGRQPISNEDGTAHVVLNGEIYNFGALRRELEARGHVFRTRSDTEAIVHAYEQWGPECVRALNGMFAFAVWDATRRTLFLARDRAGKKPLYYWPRPDRLLFASELKSLLQAAAFERVIDPEALDLYLTFGVVPPPRTIFRGVRQLPPAHALTWRDGHLSIREYWDVTPDTRGRLRPEQEYLDEFGELLTDAIRLRLVSEVPLGAFLSGGIDSTAVVEGMARQSSGRVLTTTVAFREEAFNEAPYAQTVARMLGTDHRELLVEPVSADILPTLAWYLDEPLADSSALPTYYVCRAARGHVTVALSGDGGDELFAGYEQRYRLARMEAWIRQRLPWWARRGLAAPLARVYPKREWMPRSLRLKYCLENLSVSLSEAYVLDRSIFRPADKAMLLSPDARGAARKGLALEVVAPLFERVKGHDPLAQILYLDFKTDMVNDILTKVDRMSMANSLEVRCPLLDYRIVEFAARVPVDLKLRGRITKYLLRRHLEGRVPIGLVRRPKMGFSIPLANWLRGGLRPIMQDLLLSSQGLSRGYFDPSRVAELVALHLRGARDYSGQLWSLMMLELWQRTFLDRDSNGHMPPRGDGLANLSAWPSGPAPRTAVR